VPSGQGIGGGLSTICPTDQGLTQNQKAGMNKLGRLILVIVAAPTMVGVTSLMMLPDDRKFGGSGNAASVAVGENLEEQPNWRIPDEDGGLPATRPMTRTSIHGAMVTIYYCSTPTKVLLLWCPRVL